MRARVLSPLLLIGLLLLALLPAAPSVPRAQSLEQNPLLLDIPSEPVEALDFTGETLAGKRVRLKDLRGTVIVLNFWATWCVPCLLEMPAMDRLSRKLAGQPFRLLAINQAEERALVEKFAREHQFSFDLVLDPNGTVGANYGANRLPMTYIVDRRGFVVRRAVGPREWDSDAALHLFQQLMGTAPAPPETQPVAAPAGR